MIPKNNRFGKKNKFLIDPSDPVMLDQSLVREIKRETIDQNNIMDLDRQIILVSESSSEEEEEAPYRTPVVVNNYLSNIA